MKVTILGSGSVYGTPNVFNSWGNVKNIDNPKNKRTRASTFIEVNNVSFLVDMSPEYREQINRNNIKNLDAVFLTHGHYDHICSVPELWRTAHVLQKQINVFCFFDTYNEIKTCFPFLFKSSSEKGSYSIVWNVLKENDSFNFRGVEWQTFQVKHGCTSTTVFRHQDFAIVMDVEHLSIENKEKLKNLNLLILECNNGNEVVNNGHNNLPQTLKWLQNIKPKKTILTHLSTRVDYEELEEILPENIELAYDGLIVA